MSHSDSVSIASSASVREVFRQKIVCYRPQRSWAKVIFLHVSVILLTGGGGVMVVWSGGVSNFSGGSPIFREGSPIFLAGLQIFFFLVKFFFPQNFFWDAPPPLPRRSMRGRYASHWNAFLLHLLLFEKWANTTVNFKKV